LSSGFWLKFSIGFLMSSTGVAAKLRYVEPAGVLIRLIIMENMVTMNKNPKEQIKNPIAPYKIICILSASGSSSNAGLGFLPP